jgi:glycerate dehydrogenase
MRIVVLDGHALVGAELSWDGLARLGELETFDRSTPEEVLTRSRRATVLVTNKAQITANVMDHAPELRFVAVTATGFDCVDVGAAKKHGIVVSNVPEYSTESVAQLVFALLLELCHHVQRHSDAVHAGTWSASADFSFSMTPLIELAGKTMGIVGFGRIGRSVGELAHAFGMGVVASSPSRSKAPAYAPFEWMDLDALFSKADVVSLHCPLNADTAGLVSRARLGRLKPSALLINAARGGLVIEADLADALTRGALAGAGLDVVSVEPIRADNPLLGAPHCLITPHFGWATREARRRLLDRTIANVEAFANGRPIHVVSASAIELNAEAR